MADREKVIEGLECCIPMTLRNGLADCGNCPYDRKITIDGGITECCHDLMTEVLALLKAQEPVEPYTERDGRTTFFLCGGCNKPLCIAKESYKPKYCPECGREVKWE